jgi:cytochrome P450
MATVITPTVSLSLAPALSFSSPFRFQSEARHDILGFLTRWASLGGVARFASRIIVVHLVTAPAAVQHVLQDNNKNYLKEVRSAAIFRIALGDGLFLSEGEKWRAQRKVAQPAFHRQRLAAMAASMADATDAMLERWEQFAARGSEFDLGAETSARLALDVIGRTLLGDDLPDLAEDLPSVSPRKAARKISLDVRRTVPEDAVGAVVANTSDSGVVVTIQMLRFARCGTSIND